MEQISIEQFNKLGGHPMNKVIRDMEVNTAMIIDHYGSCHRREVGRRSCSMSANMAVLGRTSDKRFKMRHLPDGRVAIACFPREPIVG